MQSENYEEKNPKPHVGRETKTPETHLVTKRI